MAKVSVLIPVYNVEKYLAQCLDSIIGQTLKDIEIICVNDGSTDSSGEILKKYRKKDRRIKIINKENGGLPSARNAGLDVATGEYISFIDSDDYVQPGMMATLYKNARETNAEIVICGANIFPESPLADGWLYQVLSPQRKFYEKCTDEMLFENPATRPFIWRTFVKRELIEREHLRLNEDIHIGEDNAFQFRIYPRAKGISIIPDKLYNYRWFRKSSLMNSIVYKDPNQKVLSHIKMILHIAEEWDKNGDMEKSAFDFLKWSVQFLYDDFIRLPLKFRASESKLLAGMWTKCGYFRYKSEFPDYIIDMFEYFYFMAEQDGIQQDVSIIMSADMDYLTLEKSIKSILQQSYEGLELIILNNCVTEKQYLILQKYLFSDKRVRLINLPKQHFTEAYNKALTICIGEYVQFILPNVWYKRNESLNEWLKQAERKQVDISLSLVCSSESSSFDNFGSETFSIINPNEYFVDASVHHALIKRDYLLENEFVFENFSIESGNVLMANLCLNTSKLDVVNKVYCVSERLYKKDWISTGECVKVLQSFAQRLDLSVEYGNKALHQKVFSLLSSDYYTNILVNNTLPYWMPDHECPDGTNSQYEVIGQIIEIINLLDPDMLGKGFKIPLIFRMIVDKRHVFISEISNAYVML